MVRAIQYKPLFERSSTWEAEYTSRYSEELSRFQIDRRTPVRLFRRACRPAVNAYVARWKRKREDQIAARSTDFDIVSLVQTPGAELYKRLCKVGRPRIVMDINDAIWTENRWGDLPGLMSEVHGIICENDYIADYARQFNSRVHVVPDSPQIEAFDRLRREIPRDPGRITLGWIGGPQNTGPLFRILEPLEALFIRYNQLHLRIVGTDESNLPPFERVRFSCRPTFNQEEMVREVLGFDIGLFPLFHNEVGRARGTLKMMVYMSGQAAVVCEDYGENPKLVKDGFNGMLASSQDDWYQKLEYLILNPEERNALAGRGLETIREGFTTERVFNRLVQTYGQILA